MQIYAYSKGVYFEIMAAQIKLSSQKNDRLLVGVLGNRNAGKSTTWNRLFGVEQVRTGKLARRLQLRPGEFVDVFLVSGSLEERREYAPDVLDKQSCRIVLCSMQYTETVEQNLDYLIERFSLYIQWLNPGYKDRRCQPDGLDLIKRILTARSALAIRNGKEEPSGRVQEIKEVIYGWALYRDLIHP